VRFIELLTHHSSAGYRTAQGRSTQPARRHVIRPGWLVIGVAAAASLCLWSAGDPAGSKRDQSNENPRRASDADELTFRGVGETADPAAAQNAPTEEATDESALRALIAAEGQRTRPADQWDALPAKGAPLPDADELPADAKRPRFSLASLVAKTVIIAILVWSAGHAAKVVLKRRSGVVASADEGALRVGERVSLGPDRNLYIVEADGRKMLISVDPTGTSLLARLDDADAQHTEDLDSPVTTPRASDEEAAAAADARRRAAKRRLVAEAVALRAREARGNGGAP
jgi:flagellar biogenesis protein FliO